MTPVLDDCGVAHAKAEIVLVDYHARLARELARAVEDHRHIRQILILGPFVHDEAVIDRQSIDVLDVEFVELREGGFKTWELVGGAGRLCAATCDIVRRQPDAATRSVWLEEFEAGRDRQAASERGHFFLHGLFDLQLRIGMGGDDEIF